MLDPEKRIRGADIRLEGFTTEELKDIIGYIRSVEAHRESRLVLVNLDVPDDGVGEAIRRILELWPEEGGPRFTLLMKKGRDGREQAQ